MTSVRLPVEHHDALRAQAEREHRTVSGQLRHLLAEHFTSEPEPAEKTA